MFSICIDYFYKIQDLVFDVLISGINLWVMIFWDVFVILSGYRGFCVLCLIKVEGFYSQVVFVGEVQCVKFVDVKVIICCCMVSDNIVSLIIDQDYFYKVVVVGINEVISDVVLIYILFIFQFKLFLLGKDVYDVDLMFNYIVKFNLFQIGVIGVVMNLWVVDFIIGESYVYVVKCLMVCKELGEIQILSNL